MTSPAAWSRKALGYEFTSDELLARALTHKSYSAANNERLEFLGDAVLGFVIAEALYNQASPVSEGDMTRLRALLVRRETLADIAREIGLGDQLRLGGGEARSGSHQRASILADALEALFGAILRDGGFVAARDAILRLFEARLADLPAVGQLKDAKTTLQEALQADGLPLPDYSVVGEEGPPHARRFEVLCSIEALDIRARGRGQSRRLAEQDAAEQVLVLLAHD